MKEFKRKFRSWRRRHANKHTKAKRKEALIEALKGSFKYEPRPYFKDQPN